MVLQKYLKDTLLDQGLESFFIQNKFFSELFISFLGSLGAAPLSDNSTELIHQIGRNVNYLGMQVILTKYENHFLFTLCQELGLSVPENQKQALINAICTLDDGHPSSSTSASSTSKASTKKQTPVKPTVHASPQAEIKKTTVVVSAAPVEKKIKSPKIHKEKKNNQKHQKKKKSKHQNQKNPKFLWCLCLL